MPSILVVSGPHQGDYYPLGHRTVTVGRDDSCVIQVVDDLVSRRHLEISYDAADGGYIASDLGSANGTFLNDRRMEAGTPLTDGDILGLGDSELMFSALDFTDRDTAFAHYREQGERGRSTVIRPRD